ncbi:TBC1 domain family member 31 [Nylanderia fulva]|uniref:TBC1 domain family member 31 n=1 Tax=Nylanderia fulva TaxID=613905 RepID=UPI0010FB54C5|nr:TBC1 domain family member 31 [Nylanderia fulva]
MMHSWNKLIKTDNSYRYEPRASVKKQHCTGRLSFTQISFDHEEECLIAVDTKGYLHYVDLSDEVPCCQVLGKVEQATFLSFNPICKVEILIGLNNGDIKLWKLHTDLDNDFYLLSGHRLASTHISFYKNYSLTTSRNEVIVWDLRSYSKAHQLKVGVKNAVIKKAAFSNLGHIVVLYLNDTMQAWTFGQLHKDIKIDTSLFGMRYIKDFVFTRDARAMIMSGAGNLSVLNTYDWSLLKKLLLPENLVEARQLSVVPSPLDGGANKILAFLSSKSTLQLCDINSSEFLKTPTSINGVKKLVVSSNGRYIGYIDQEGCLNITYADKIILRKHQQLKKPSEPPRLQAHRISDHLECVKQRIKQELNIERLTSILKEFGEFPDKYRTLIWSAILKLPANKDAYIALASKVTRGKLTSNTWKDHPLADRSKASLLAMTMDCLSQWCPLLIQSPFLPSLIFPFLVVFQKDPLLAFELVLSILLNYCQKWFEYHPLPPLNVLGIVENILLEADPALLNIFCENGVTSSEYAWPLLRTAMSEVLSGDEWLILWDHLIASQRPSLLLMCVVAYNVYSRENIISLIRSRSGNVQTFYSTQSHVRTKDLLRIARRLDRETEERVHPNRYLRDELLQLNHVGPYLEFIKTEYPKFLVENLNIADLRKLKTQEHLQERNRKIAELERKRLHAEAKAFAKQTHERRLNEVQKCFQEYINLNGNFEKFLPNVGRGKCHSYKDIENLQLKKIQECNKCKITKDGLSNFEDSKSKNCEKLQQDVTKLEYEVQSFLDSLRSRRSAIS